MSVSLFIDDINKNLSKLFESFNGSRIYGLSQSVIRTKTSGVEMIPALVDKNGEGKYIGFDDVSPIILYHKVNTITTAIVPNGRGDSYGDHKNTYQNSLVLFNNRKKTKLLPDEILVYIQANYPEQLSVPPYKTIFIRFGNVILNSQQVYASEYRNVDYLLPESLSLMQIEYSIESVFKKGCFNKCPC